MGVSNAWGDTGFENNTGTNGIKFHYTGDSDYSWGISLENQDAKDLGEITKLFLKEFYVHMYQSTDNISGDVKMYYQIKRQSEADGLYTLYIQNNWSKWLVDTDQNSGWKDGYRHPKFGNNSSNINLLDGLGSGKYCLRFYMYEAGSKSRLSNGGSNYTLNWTYNIVPSVNNFKVTASNVVSGTGTSGDPYVIACGKTTTLTISGDQASTDANSSLYAKFGSDAYSSTLTKTLTPSSTKQSIEVKAKYYNSSDDLSGAETPTQTIYYRAQTFAVNITSSGNGNVEPSGEQQVGATNFNITATPKIGYSFTSWTATAGISVVEKNSASTTITATNEGTVTANFEAQPATTVYLKTTANWKSANARFAIYYWGANGQNGWVNMTEVDCNRDYFKGEIPYGCTGCNFVRMNPSQPANNWANKWNKTTDLTIPNENGKCYTITDDHWSDQGEGEKIATGTWTAFNPTVNLTLKSSSHGTYKISYEGKTYESSLTENIVIRDLPLDAKIIISESATPNTGYKLKKRYIKLGTNEKVEATTNTPYTLCGSTTISANFVTILPHTVYLNITNHNWSNDGAKLAIYVFDETDQEGQGTWIALEPVEGYSNYYTATIPAGESNFNFVRLHTSTLNWSNKWNQTGNLAIPVTRYNTFTLTSFGTDGKDATGVWETGAAFSGDYRLAYVEQVVANGEGANNWKTVINNTGSSHTPDDIIRKRENGRDTISLFINVDGDNPEIILQQYRKVDGINKWVDIEAHMINGPLKAGAGMALINGRRNASPDSDIDDFVYDADGIDAITESGVWNFVIVQDADGNNASLRLKEGGNVVTHKYTGNYYIRTDNAAGGWNTYTHPDNIMSRSTYSESGYTHYYCKWVKEAQQSNVKFIVATDYSINVSKVFDKDDYTKNDGTLPENANVRWSWNETTNEVKRAYIKGSTEQDFLTVTKGNNPPTIFRDNGNWIYEADITAKVNEKITAITALYNNHNQSLLEDTYQTGGMPMLTGDGNNTSDYTVRVQYDFKINKTIVYLIPTADAVATSIDVLIERTNQGDATQVSVPITASNPEKGYTVYAVMSFTKTHIVEGNGTQSEKLYYWVSFPFDVRISDVFGFGEYGVHWIMEYYDGAERAKNGAWIDSPTYWRYITDTTSVGIPANNKNLNCGILKANQGYVLALALNIANMGIFTNTDKVSLYFPSMEPIKDQIDKNIIETTVTLDEYKCNIERDNRKIHDSNWHIIGVPSFSNKPQTLTQKDLLYFYTRDQKNDTYNPTSAKDAKVTFKSLHSYMVQYAGTINWATEWTLSQPQGLAAKRNANEKKTHSLRLELSQNGTYNDQTLVTLQEEGATEAFDMNLDLSKMMNAGNNIYTLAGKELIQVAGNALPIANTTIPVGVQIAKAGEYTFAMPDGTDGITVELIDNETNTRTNLLLSDYTVNLPAGTCETRFALSVKIDKTATSVENITEVEGANGEGVKKYIIDGKLFLQKDNTLYDAQGHIVR